MEGVSPGVHMRCSKLCTVLVLAWAAYAGPLAAHLQTSRDMLQQLAQPFLCPKLVPRSLLPYLPGAHACREHAIRDAL